MFCLKLFILEEGSQEEDEEEEGSDGSDVPSEGGDSADVQPPKSLEEHAFKDDEGNSTDVLKLGDANGRFAVEVIVPKKNGETRVIYSYNNSTTGIDLIHDLSEAVGATIDPRMCSIKCGASRIELFESLHGYAYNAESIRLEIRVKGGALVRKSYVKKDDRMAVLVKKSKAFIAKRFDERMEVEGVMPESLRHFLVPIQDSPSPPLSSSSSASPAPPAFAPPRRTSKTLPTASGQFTAAVIVMASHCLIT